MIKPNALFTRVVFSLSIAILVIPMGTQAELRATSIGDDPIVLDVPNEQNWYPLMSNMIQMTKGANNVKPSNSSTTHISPKSRIGDLPRLPKSLRYSSQ